MTIDDVIRDFATTGSTLPRASIRWALDNWEEACPALIESIERYIAGEDQSEGCKDVVLFAVHLIGQRAESRAFPALCRLMRAAEASDDALGDAETTTLPQIVVGAYNGDMSALADVIEDPEADEFVRYGVLMAMAYLTRQGRISDEQMRAYLLHLFADMRPQAESFVWIGWVTAVSALGYADYTEPVERLFRRGLVGRSVMSIEHFREDLRRTLDDPDRLVGFEPDGIRPFGDAIETLEGWYYFTEEYKRDQARDAARRARDEKRRLSNGTNVYPYSGTPYINEYRHVGRNDPCPCRSGRKYKKCCLHAGAEAEPSVLSANGG